MSTVAASLLALVGTTCLVGLAVARSLLADEVRAWLPHLTRSLVQSAARKLPVGEQDRWEAEWLAEIAAWSDRPLSSVAKAAHLRWRARAMHAAVVGIALKGMRLKRAMDVAGAAVMLALLLPLLGGIAFAIKVGSPGPVFFVQRRTGRGGKPFFLLKFRTFRAEVMEPRPHPWRDGLLDLADDPRLTPMGSFLRRTSLDELPVLVNVLRGDMSLVGPTALPAASNSSDEPPEAAGRYAVRPGMTGPSQIMSYTDPPQDAARRDLDYASGRSFIGDIKLLFRTVGAVLTRRPPRS